MTGPPPEGHPLPWANLRPYEQQQGGYWLYPPGCGVYGDGKRWINVRRPQQAERGPDYSYSCPECQWRTRDTRHEEHACPGDLSGD